MSSLQNPSAFVMPSSVHPALQLSRITKTFGRVKALNDVSFSADAGEIHAIVGENGAGKSTLINIAAGVLEADTGTVAIKGVAVARPAPRRMREAGIAVAYQHPALPAELTVRECFMLVSRAYEGATGHRRAEELLSKVATRALHVDPKDRIGDLTVAQKHVVEIARALASAPAVLVLDEPTEPFQEGDVHHLFGLLRTLRDEGCCIVYISHRLHEVDQLADRISVLRDGELIETKRREAYASNEIVELIVGRPLGQVFPAKLDEAAKGREVLGVSALSGHRFEGVNLTVAAGEVVGLAGVEGQGQREFIRALAGLVPISSGDIAVAGTPIRGTGQKAARDHGIRFVPDDRHAEGLFMSMSIQENIGMAQLASNSSGPFVDASRELESTSVIAKRLRVKADSLQDAITTLSGGNQQKVLMGREIGSSPRVILVDEPTKGVDVGARSEIYQQLRDIARSGVAVVVASSDGVELQGLCDRVLVFARGAVQAELSGTRVTDDEITKANLSATSLRSGGAAAVPRRNAAARLLRSDYLPAAVLLLITCALALWTQAASGKFLTAYNAGIVLTFMAALALVSFGQLCVMLVGEIDLSVGPLAGLAVVIASFMMPAEASSAQLVGAAIAVVVLCALIGFAQGMLTVWLGLPSVIITLATFFGLQGVGLFLRPKPEGMINNTLLDVLGAQYLVLPAAFIAVLVLAAVMEWALWHKGFGRAVRAVGADSPAALKLGVDRRVVVPVVFALAGCFTGLGGVIVAAEVGFGSAAAGVNYTLMSITAVVLGGVLMTGGRGSFVCTVLGAALVQTMYSSTAFLNISSAWQYWMVATATLGAAAVFSLGFACRRASGARHRG